MSEERKRAEQLRRELLEEIEKLKAELKKIKEEAKELG
jgi:F0F1-type ATP synthase membrane subunit b/b'